MPNQSTPLNEGDNKTTKSVDITVPNVNVKSNEDEELDEHIFTPVVGSTSMKCSCGKQFSTTGEQDQHIQWHQNIAISSLLVERERLARQNTKDIIKMADSFTFEDGTKVYSEKAVTKRERLARKDRTEILDALYWMYIQYCSQGGHLFMGAGENASSILEDAGYFEVDSTGVVTKNNEISDLEQSLAKMAKDRIKELSQQNKKGEE